MTTHIPISIYHISEKCASDIENFAWNRKICLKSYVHARDGAGEIVSLRNVNVTNTRPSQEKNQNWFLGRKILFVGDSHIQGLSDLFFNQVCQDKRVHEVKKELTIELDSDIQSVVDYYNVMYRREDNDRYLKKLKYCRSMYMENGNFDDCVLFEEFKDKRKRRDLEKCIKANAGGEIPAQCMLFDIGCMDSTVTYIGAHYCQDDVVRYMKDYDFIVVNCGNHAAKMGKYSYEYFRASVNAMALKMSQTLNTNKIQLFWVENYAEPLRYVFS